MEYEIFIKKLGKKIAKIRQEKKLTQSDLARLMGLPRQNINRLETGTDNPKAHTIYEMARAMKVPVGELMEV